MNSYRIYLWWLYVLQNLSRLQDVPQSLKGDRDLINSFDTTHNDGVKKGIKEGIKQEKVELAKASLKQNIDTQTIALITGLTLEEIEVLNP